MQEKLSAAQIRTIHSLSTKKGRKENGMFVVEGEKIVAEALESGLEVLAVYRRDEIGENAMSRISALDSPSPVLAVVRIPKPEVPKVESGLCLALDGVKDPGNLGTIIRIADWFGISKVYASPESVDQFNPKVVQSTMGAILRHRVCYCDIPQLCRDYRAAGRQVMGTFMDGENIYSRELPAEGLIVMGSESFGISPETAQEVSCRLHIPSFAVGKGAESLNVAVATAITVSEIKSRTI